MAPVPIPAASHSDELIIASQRARRRAQRVMVATVVFSSIFFFGSAAGAVLLANTGHLALLREIGTGIGAVGIVLGMALIFRLLSQPPYSTGEIHRTLRLLRDTLTPRR